MPTAKTTGPEGATPRQSRPRFRIKPRPASIGYSDKIPARRTGRVVGFILDKVILHALVAAFGSLFAFVGGPIFSLLYFTGQDTLLGAGRSLGRAATGQRLMTADGEAVSHFRAAGRGAVRWLLWATILPFFIDMGLVLFGNGRIIADYVFDTRVYEDPLRVRQRFLAEGKDQASLRAQEADLWAGEVEDEFMEAARKELEESERAGIEQSDLDDFERRLGGQPKTVDLHLDAALPEDSATIVEGPEVRPTFDELDDDELMRQLEAFEAAQAQVNEDA